MSRLSSASSLAVSDFNGPNDFYGVDKEVVNFLKMEILVYFSFIYL